METEKEEFIQKSGFQKFFEEKRVRGVGLLILACIYIISPWDVIPERELDGILPHTDDILAFILACIKSYGMGKNNV